MTTAATVKPEQLIDLDKAIVVRSQDGSEVRRIKTKLKLTIADGSLVKIIKARPASGRWPAVPATVIPTASAYMKLASTCGVCLKHPDTVTVNGVQQPNGYCSPDGTYYFRMPLIFLFGN